MAGDSYLYAETPCVNIYTTHIYIENQQDVQRYRTHHVLELFLLEPE